jgi:putative FmdB family regulatory protein
MLYDYECRDCGTIFEIRKSLKDPSPVICQDCQSANVIKLYGNLSMIFVSWRRPLGMGHDGYIIMAPPGDKYKTARRSAEKEQV